MLRLEGIPIAPGFASGTAVIYDYEVGRRLEVLHSNFSPLDVESKWKRLDNALERSRQDLQLLEQTSSKRPNLSKSVALLSAHSAMRGLRFSLAERTLLEEQLYAILQVAQSSEVHILFPMVIGGDDLSQAIAAVDRVVKKFGFLQTPPIGAMIETPAALYALDEILDLADFVALGTNDLSQYMLATDRNLAVGQDDCTAMHPAVLRAIKQVVLAAEKHQCPVYVCGEEAGDADLARLLIGLGIRELSLNPGRGVAVREALHVINSQAVAETANQALRCQNPIDVRKLLGDLRTTETELTPSFLAAPPKKMHYNKKPEPLNNCPTPGKCPVCGYSTYSSSGIHPQCAVSQADEPRRLRLVAERKAKVDLVKKDVGRTKNLPGVQLL